MKQINLARSWFAPFGLLLSGVTIMFPAAAAENEWTLATQDTEIRIGVRADAEAILELHAVGSPWQWVQSPNVQEFPKSVIQDGVTRDLHWTYSGATPDPDHHALTLVFKNASPAIELKTHWKATPGLGPIEHWMTLKNNSGDRLTLGGQPSLTLNSMTMPAGRYVESTQVRRGGSNAQVSGGVLTQPVGNGWNVKVTSRPSNGGARPDLLEDLASQVPFLNLQVEGSHGLYVGWKFSGLGEILGSTTGSALTLSVGVLKDFKTDILAGEEFLVPAAFIGTYRGTQDEGAYSLHRYIQESLLPKRPADHPFPSLVYGYYFDNAKPGTQTEADVLSSARLAHELGFETFLADAMWFPATGDWRWDPKRFPNGSKPLSDYLHANGMKFALWMAWTLASDSDAPGALNYRRQPQWFTQPPEFMKEGNIHWWAQIDVGNDDARRWVQSETARVVRENNIDYLKTDYSPIAITSQAQRTHGQSNTDVSYWSTLGYYQIQEKLKETFPDLMLEGCSAGGNIKDFGNIAHVHYVVGTDTLSAMADRQSIYDTSFMFPPATVSLYTYQGGVYSDVADASEPYLWRSGMMGAWDLALTKSKSLTERQKQQIRRATDVYKSWIRPVLQDAHVHHILPRPDGVHWDGLFYWNASINKGTAYIFRPNSELSHQVIRLAGLDSKKRYKIHGEDGSVRAGVFSGEALKSDGVEVRLPTKFSSELVYVEQAP